MKITIKNDEEVYAVVVMWDYTDDERGKYDGGFRRILHLTTSKEEAEALLARERKEWDWEEGAEREYVDIKKLNHNKGCFWRDLDD